MGAALGRIFAGWPTWAVVAGATAVAIAVLLGFLSSFWLGLGLLVIAVLAVAAYWAWMELPKRYDEGPDSAERAERERRAPDAGEESS